MNAIALPTRRDEAWHYADFDALARLWPLPAVERIVVPAGGVFSRAIVQESGGVRQIGLVVGLFFALLGDRWIFRTDALPIGKPVDLAFFGVQLMGLTAALLMANLQALPKRA